MPVFLNECESGCFTGTGEHRIRQFENAPPEVRYVTVGLRKSHNETLHGLQSSQNIMKAIKSRMMYGRGMWAVWGR